MMFESGVKLFLPSSLPLLATRHPSYATKRRPLKPEGGPSRQTISMALTACQRVPNKVKIVQT